jgi:hypothetical protein
MRFNFGDTMQQAQLMSPDHAVENDCFKRNNYFYGKVMDVHQFRMETEYFNAKRWTINKLVFGHGVLCGIDVFPGPDGKSIELSKGAAFDKWGREIIVPHRSRPVPLPHDIVASAHEACGRDERPCIHAVLCYRECLGDPMPIHTGDCCNPDPCAPGTIRERYCLEFRVGCAPEVEVCCRLPDVVEGDCLNYKALVRWVTDRGCPKPVNDPCIVIANIHFHRPRHGHATPPPDIDINVRQIVFTNRLIAELVPCILGCDPNCEEDE